MKVFIIAALTADGFIGKDSGHSADWTSREDKQLFVRLTKEAGVMVMGSRTFDTIGRALPGRKTIVYTSHPEKYQAIENIETSDAPPADLIKKLEKDGYPSVAICGGNNVYTQFLQAGVVEELYLTIEPILFGQGISLLGSATEKRLTLVDSTKLNENAVLLQYSVQN